VSSPSLTGPEPATSLLKDRVRTLFKHLPAALAGEEEAIHQMRVAGRRLRVALPLLARKPEAKRVRRCLRRLRNLIRTAGASRDLDVSLALYEERLRQGAQPAPAEATTLLRSLRAARRRSHARMAQALLDLDLAALRRDLRRVVSRRGEGLFTVFVRIREARDRQGALLLSGLHELGDRYEPEALHRLRFRARRLRYLAEVAPALKDQPSDAPALLKELQEALGGIHDAHVLAGWLARQAAAAERAGRAERAAAARAQQAALQDLSRGQHRALLERDPASLVSRALELMGLARSAA